MPWPPFSQRQPPRDLPTGTAPPETDRTLKDAEEDARRDFARLAHGHIVSWSIDIFRGTVRYTCSCSSPGPRDAQQLDQHLLSAVRSARGPKPYKRT